MKTKYQHNLIAAALLGVLAMTNALAKDYSPDGATIQLPTVRENRSPWQLLKEIHTEGI